LPLEVISGSFAESAVVRPYPSSFSDLVLNRLKSLHQRLICHLPKHYRLRENSSCQYSDDQASRDRDAAATSRFFKLFPAIGWEAEGLQVYASFVVDLVRVKAPASAKSEAKAYLWNSGMFAF